ncbi:MAG: hypothetical protein QM784_17410 [Polyangiaceae bacterium]
MAELASGNDGRVHPHGSTQQIAHTSSAPKLQGRWQFEDIEYGDTSSSQLFP